MVNVYYAHPSTSLRMRPDVHGFSPGLTKCPPDTLLPHLWWGRPFESLLCANKKAARRRHFLWRRVRDSNPRFLSESLVFKTSSLNRSDNSPWTYIISSFHPLVKQPHVVLILPQTHRIFHTFLTR